MANPEDNIKDIGNLVDLLAAFLNLLKSHAEFTAREYKRNPGYNSDSIGFKEEKEAIEVIHNYTGKSITELIGM